MSEVLKNDNKLSLSWLQIIMSLLVITATITMLFADVKSASERNTAAICEIKEQQSDEMRLLYEIKLNLKQLMTQQGFEYQEVN